MGGEPAYPETVTTPQRVEADLGWALARVVRAHLRTAEAVLAELPGGPRGHQVLAAAREGRPNTQLALARKLGIDRTVMTYLIDELVGAGLVERRPDPADRRARQILLTGKGEERLCTAQRRLREAEEHLLDPLEPVERDQLRALLQKLACSTDPATPCEVAAAVQECAEH
jgi:DNA-binding MarR family transcriptional regulator